MWLAWSTATAGRRLAAGWEVKVFFLSVVLLLGIKHLTPERGRVLFRQGVSFQRSPLWPESSPRHLPVVEP